MSDAPAKLSPRLGWVPFHRRDLALIVEQGERPGVSTSAVICVWLALMSQRELHRSNSFSVSVGILRKTVGLGRSQTFAALAVLEDLQLVSIEQVKATSDRTEKTYLAPSNYTVFPSQPLPLPSPKAGRGVVQKPDEPSPGVTRKKSVGEVRASAKQKKGKDKKEVARLEDESGVEDSCPLPIDSASPSMGGTNPDGLIPGMKSWRPAGGQGND